MPRLIWGSEDFRRAIAFAAVAHRDQVRRGSGVPYIVHPFLVARIVEQAGFDDVAVIAALLHDVVEDTPTTLDEIEAEFGKPIVAIVAGCTEVKVAPDGQPIPWEARKKAHLDRLRTQASIGIRAVMLADKLDNLRSIEADLAAGRQVWDLFHADRERVLGYCASTIITCECGDERIQRLGDDCRRELDRVRQAGPEKTDLTGPAT